MTDICFCRPSGGVGVGTVSRVGDGAVTVSGSPADVCWAYRNVRSDGVVELKGDPGLWQAWAETEGGDGI